MIFVDSLLEGLVLKYGAPIRIVDVSGIRGVSLEASNTENGGQGITRGGLTAPFKAVGVCQMDETVAAPIQEVMEGSWQQWFLLIFGPAALALVIALSVLIGVLSHTPILGFVAAGLSIFGLSLTLPKFQTGQSELTSHAVSWAAQKRWPGVSDERCYECWIPSLKGYSYASFSGKTDDEFKQLVLAKLQWANAYLARPEIAALCQKLAAGA